MLTIHIVAVQIVFDQDAPDIIDGSPLLAGVHVLQRRVARASGILWSKEQLINIAWRQLPRWFDSIVWMDGDIAIKSSSSNNAINIDWPEQVYETLHQPGNHNLAMGQVWTTCDLLGPYSINGEQEVQRNVTSFAAQHAALKVYQDRSNRHDEYWHPGFCWMATRQALEATGGLIHRTLGSADRHMAMAFLGRADESLPDGIHCNYRKQVMDWQAAIQRYNIQFLVVQPDIHIQHYWHGSLARRQYEERWKILLDHKFDPEEHLAQDDDTDLDYWTENCPEALMAAIIHYFEYRQEDSTQVQPEDILIEDDDTAATAAISTSLSGDVTTHSSVGERGIDPPARTSADADTSDDQVPSGPAVATVPMLSGVLSSTHDSVGDLAYGQATAVKDAFSFYA